MNSTYKGGLFLLLGFALVPGIADKPQNLRAENLPAIYIERKIDQSETLIPKLKMQYEWCVTQKRVAQKAFRENSVAWPAMKESLSSEYVSHIRASPVPEPDWKKEGVGISVEEEYFYGDKYAHIRYGKKFRISRNDGLCRLETYGEYEKQDIDNGEYRYKVTLKNKKTPITISGGSIAKKDQFKYAKVRQSISPVLVRKQNDAQLKKLAEDHPEYLQNMADRMFSERLDHLAVPPKATREDAEVIREAFKLEESHGVRSHTGPGAPGRGGENYVLKQLCDIVESKVTKGKIWYWQIMRHYPTVMERPIILKKEQKLSQCTVVKEATRFEVRKQFKDEIFEPPPGIKITRAGGLRKLKPSTGSAATPAQPGIK
ncbi:MAG TPA: hypothetical protein EYH06_11405 [Chromatiales bacterium]|nr:hypothetical protein [Thiotrichales bacterium]HIP69167.1 hypothetical protein [Chromatiales bacterium]